MFPRPDRSLSGSRYPYRDRSSSYSKRPTRDFSPKRYDSFSSSNAHTNHLWNFLEDQKILSDPIIQLLKNQNKNLNGFKGQIQREKNKVSVEVQNLKKQIQHNLQDCKLSIQASLDSIYRLYMQKYAKFKGEIMQIKQIRDALDSHDPKRINTESKFGNNSELIRSFRDHQKQVKKYHMLSYISQMEREKLIPIQRLSNQLLILTEYENGFYQNKQFNKCLSGVKSDFNTSMRNLYQIKYQYIRDPQQLMQKQNVYGPKVLQGLQDQLGAYHYQPSVITQHVTQQPVTIHQQKHHSSPNLDSITPQIAVVSHGDTARISHQGTLRILESGDVLLCSLQVKKNQLAVGGKNGSLVIYDIPTNRKIASLQGHNSSVCSLAMVQHDRTLYLASGSDHGCSCICLWNTQNWRLVAKLQNHRAAVTSILDLKDNITLVTGSYDKKINIWNLQTMKLAYHLAANQSAVTALALNKTCTKLISCGLDNCLSVWQIVRTGSSSRSPVETMFVERTIENNTPITALLASGVYQNLIIVGTKDGKIKLVDISRGSAYKVINSCNNAIVEIVAIERSTKPEYPILAVWPCLEPTIKFIDTEKERVTSSPINESLEFACGIGPKAFFLRNGNSIGVLSQNPREKQVSFYKVDVI